MVGVVVAACAVQVEYAVVGHLKVKVATFCERRLVVPVGLRTFCYIFVVRARRLLGTCVVAGKLGLFGGGAQARVANAALVGADAVCVFRDYAARVVLAVQLFV